jgi:hypothetical protein
MMAAHQVTAQGRIVREADASLRGTVRLTSKIVAHHTMMRRRNTFRKARREG